MTPTMVAPSECFSPIVDEATRILILGSLPGRESLLRGQYYAHTRNQFWRLIGGVLSEPVSALSYDGKIACLRANGIGLWDCIARAQRPGSLDSAIRQASHNDLGQLMGQLRRLELVAFNGTKAAAMAKILGCDIVTVTLPSSSPANTLSFDLKLRLWRSLLGTGGRED